jgi:hypothetical protein
MFGLSNPSLFDHSHNFWWRVNVIVHWPSDILTPWNNSLIEKLIIAQLVKKSSTACVTHTSLPSSQDRVNIGVDFLPETSLENTHLKCWKFCLHNWDWVSGTILCRPFPVTCVFPCNNLTSRSTRFMSNFIQSVFVLFHSLTQSCGI